MITKATQPSEPQKPMDSVGKVLAKKKKKTAKAQKDWLHCSKCNKAYKSPDKLEKHQASCDGKHKGGMPAGYITPEKRQLIDMKKEMQQVIANRAPELIAAQFSMAMGNQKLYCRHKVIDEREKKDGTIEKKITYDVREITNQADFLIYLSLPHDERGRALDKDNGDEYFYGVMREGNQRALENLLDRAFGKPKESVELSDDPDAPVGKHGTGTTTALREAFVELVKSQIKSNSKGAKSGKS